MITRNVLNMIEPADVYLALGRHLRCDWGFVCEHDKLENEYSLDNHLRILSVYEDSKGHRFWIITEADRSATTILLPEDY